MRTIVIVLMFLILAGIAYAADTACDNTLSVLPCNVTTPLKLDLGLTKACPTSACIGMKSSLNLSGLTLYANGSSGAGAINIYSSNVLLDCFWGTITGNLTLGTRGIQSSLFDNLLIQKCNFINYSTGVSIQNGQNITILNTSVRNTIRDGFLVYGNYNMTLANNFIYSVETFTSGFAGINMVKASSKYNLNSTIFGNTVVGFDQSIYCQNGSNIIVANNTFNRSIVNSIQFGCNYSTIKDNQIYNSTRNGISIDDKYINVTGNLIRDHGHGGIDLFDSAATDQAQFVKIWNNVITGTSNLDEPNSGIYICNSSDHEIWNNTIYDLNAVFNDNETGIKIDCDVSQTFNNIIYNNNISGMERTCIWVVDNNASIYNNTLSNCGYETDISLRSGSNNVWRYNQLTNNIFPGGSARYLQTFEKSNVTIAESNSIVRTINLSNSASVVFNYGMINITLANNSLTFNPIGTTYYIYNRSGNNQYALSSGTITLNANENYDVKTDCLNISNPYIINDSTILCANQQFYVNATSDTTGALTIGGNNVILNCNGSSIIGNGVGYGILTNGVTNVKIINCNISNYQVGLRGYRPTNFNFSNNYIQSVQYGIATYGSQNGNIFSNIVKNTNRTGIVIAGSGGYSEGNRTNITSNIIDSGDIGIMIDNGYTIEIKQNTILNMTKNSDAYNTGIYLRAVTNRVNITNNTIEYGHLGIFVQRSSNVNIYNTTCNQISLNDAINRIDITKTWSRDGSPIHYFEPTACILAGEQYKGFTGDGDESMAKNLTNYFTNYRVNGLTVDGINANENVQTYLHLVGLIGYKTLNLPANWYVNLTLQTNMTDSDEFYNSNAWNELKIVPSTVSGISNIFTKNRAGMNNPACDEVNYSISKTKITINGSMNSINIVQNFTNLNISVLNISNMVPFNNIPNKIINKNIGETFEISTTANGLPCFYPQENYTANYSQSICSPYTYQCNDTEGDGCIKIGANNVNLSCAGASLRGSSITNSQGIKIANNYDNTLVKDCNLYNYDYGIWTYTGTDNTTIFNNTFNNMNYAGVHTYNAHQRLNISNNTFNNASLFLANTNNVTVYGNTISCPNYQCGTTRKECVYLSLINYTTFDSNTFYNCNKTFDIRDVFYDKFQNNNLFNSYNYGISSIRSSSNYFYNNLILGGDIGMLIQNESYSNFSQNNISNITKNSDGYNLGVYITKDSKFLAFSNTNLNYAHTGIFIQKSTNISLINTACNQISLQDKLNGLVSQNLINLIDDFEPTACIYSGEIYKSYLGDSSESDADTIAKISSYNSTNISIDGVTANSNVQTILRTQGTKELYISNMPSYWLTSFNFPSYLVDTDVFYNSNSWDTLYIVPSLSSGITSILSKNYNSNTAYAKWKGNYSISKTHLYFKNINQTTTYNLSLFNLTDQPNSRYAQVFLSNQSTPINSINQISYCYQESANVATSCGGLATGDYFTDLDQSKFSLVVDGDWTTPDTGSPWNGYTVWVNYTIPSIMSSAIWQVKQIGSAAMNISIDQKCFSNNNGKLVLKMDAGASDNNYYCFNSTDWINLYQNTPTMNAIQEEGIYWVKVDTNTNPNEFNVTMGPNNVSQVFTRQNDLDFKFSNLNSIINSLSVSNEVIEFSCTGNGFNASNILSQLRTDNYQVYKDGIYQGDFQTNDFASTTCSTWRLVKDDIVNIPPAAGGGTPLPVTPDGHVDLPMNPDGSYNFSFDQNGNLVLPTQQDNKSFVDVIQGKYKQANNSKCDDGEYPFIDKDCELTLDAINCKGDRCIFTEAWFAKLMILLLLFLIFNYKKDNLVWIILIALLLLFNYSGMGSLAPAKPMLNITADQAQYNLPLKYGAMVMPSNPLLGFGILALIIYLIVRNIYQKTSKTVDRLAGGRR